VPDTLHTGAFDKRTPIDPSGHFSDDGVMESEKVTQIAQGALVERTRYITFFAFHRKPVHVE
jgi:hypothetical protein